MSGNRYAKLSLGSMKKTNKSVHILWYLQRLKTACLNSFMEKSYACLKRCVCHIMALLWTGAPPIIFGLASHEALEISKNQS